MAQATRGFARFAPARNNPTRQVRIRVSDMTGRDTAWWDARVQPAIARTPGRADRFWVWSTLLPVLLLHQLSKRRQCRPLVLWAFADNGRLVRAAMSLLIERYPRLDIAMPGFAHFLWFVSAAPDSILARFGVSDPPSLGRVSVDNCLVLSENAALAGRIGLHAAPAGGARLLHFYQTNCQLIQLPATAALPPTVRRSNDGRFFYTDDARSAVLLRQGDPYR